MSTDKKIEKRKWSARRIIILIVICLSVFTVGYVLLFNTDGLVLEEETGSAPVSPVKKREVEIKRDEIDSNEVKQPRLITIGESFNITSLILDEEREILLYLPDDYRQSSAKYHVLYLLDGRRNFYFTSGIVQYLSMNCYIPKLMVVGIPNKNLYDRDRNYTPKESSAGAFSGSAESFLRFIEEEVIPYIESNYRTYPYRILTGHSLGGFFTIYSLLSKPALFNAYVAVSPSLWWDNGSIIGKSKTFFSNHHELKKVLALTLCQEGELMFSSLKKFERIVRKRMPKGLTLYVRFMDDEDKDDHITTVIRSTALALRAIYKNWQLPDHIIEKGLRSMKTHIIKLSDELGYNIVIPEYLANKMGYGYVYEKKYKMAINMFKYNAEIYPHSGNVYDSLAEAYMLDGQYGAAIENYSKALEIDPGNGHVRERLRQIERKLEGNR